MATLASTREIPNAARAAIQILAMRKNGRLSENDWLELLKLQSHLVQVKATSRERKHEVEVLAKGVWTLSQSEGFCRLEMAEHIFTMVLTNALTLVTSVFDPMGIMVDPLACTANHSCDPNAVVVFEGTAFSFRALKPIQKDEEIFTSYVDNTNPFATRQRELKDRYYFTCQCTKCTKGPTLREDAWAKPASALSAEWKEMCRSFAANNRTESAPGSDEDSKLLAALQSLAISYLDKGHYASDPSAAIPHYTAGLRLCASSTMFPAARQPYPTLRHELMLALFHLGQYTTAWQHALKTYFDVDPILYPQPHHPLRVVHNYALAKQTDAVRVRRARGTRRRGTAGAVRGR